MTSAYQKGETAMYLKEIEMENFKSFGKKIKIPFYPGFTGITGPNGSGKSNISDAILFVLGPKSSKVLRAGKLSELIHNGGKKGRPARECRVTLVFDNSDRVIPINSDEVRLTRVVRRSSSRTGDVNSYFYINGKKASLSDFDQLLARARISADGYNFVQQGDVNRIAQMGAVERRKILDEISGISRFDEDIKKAEKKKEEAEANLGRISILLDEIKSRVDSLDAERKEAARYVELREQLRTAKAQMAYKKMLAIESEMRGVEEQLSSREEEKQRLEEEKRRLTGLIEEVEKQIEEIEKEMAAKTDDSIKEIQEKLEAARVERVRARDGIEDATSEISERKKAIKELSEKKRELEKALQEKRKKLVDLVEKKKAVEKELEKIRKEREELEKTASEQNARVGEMKKEERALVESLENHRKKLGEIQVEKEKIKTSLESTSRDLGSAEEKKKNVVTELKDIEWEIKEIKKEGGGDVQKLQKRFYELKNEEKKLVEKRTALDDELRTIEREYERVRAKVESVEGSGGAVNAILSCRDRGELGGIIGTLAEVISPRDAKYELALAVAAGPRMNAIVVETDEDAERAIKYLKKHKLGRATFLPLNKMVESRPRGKAILASRHPEALGFAIDLIEYDERYAPAVWYAFGDTVVVKDLQTARKLMGGVRLVTLEGELIEVSGAMVGGNLEKREKMAFSRGDLEKIGEKLRNKRAELEDVERRLGEIRKELVSLENRIREINMVEGKKSVRIELLEKKKKELQDEKTLLDRETRALRNKMERLTAKIAELEKKEEELESVISKTEELLGAVREKLSGATEGEMGQRLRELAVAEKETLRELEKLNREIGDLSPLVAVDEEKVKTLSERIRENEQEIEAREKLIEKLREKLEKAEAEVRSLGKILSEKSSEVEALRQTREELLDKKRKYEAEREKVASAMETKDDFYISLKARLNTLREQHAGLESEYREYGVEVHEPLPSVDTLKRRIAEINRALEEMGAVNLKALDEYEEQRERYERLTAEMEQVKKEKRDLEKLVRDLEERKKEGLMAVFNEVNKNFREVYRRLSMGGEAELILENPDSPFEGGLLISARPPGKKVLRIEALSGGEKSLVSMAFIIAIQQYDPSPFYVFDEVDQNLDALNAENLAKMIKEDSENAQFIMISLRKVSLKEADHLYGVTIRDGVSEMLGFMNLDELPEEPSEDGTRANEGSLGEVNA